MDNYIAYHSVELMGRDYAPAASFSFHSDKPEKYLRGTIGSRVWVLVGRREGRRTIYELVGVYTPEVINAGANSGWDIEGPGQPFVPVVDMTKLPWFKALLAEQKNFSLGLNRIRDAEVLSHFETLRNRMSLDSDSVNLGHLNLSEYCVYTIVSSDILEQHALDGSSMQRTERKSWATARKLFARAQAQGQSLPVLFADAKDCSRLLYWGVLQRLEISGAPASTTYAIDRLRPFLGVRTPQELRLMQSGEFIAANYIRPYANCLTPAFLSDAPHDVSKAVFLSSGEGPAPETLVEGAAITVTVSKHERNQAARQLCIEHYGCSCWVCQMEFSAVYGPELGANYIHVHHLVPLAEIGGSYVVDPIKDLRPVCPNCHAMIHRKSKTLSIDLLRDRVQERRRGLTQQ